MCETVQVLSFSVSQQQSELQSPGRFVEQAVVRYPDDDEEHRTTENIRLALVTHGNEAGLWEEANPEPGPELDG